MQMDQLGKEDIISDYQKWVSEHRFSNEYELAYKPSFSIILPLISSDCEETVRSILAQTYCDYELIIIINSNENNLKKKYDEDKLIIEEFSYSTITEAYNHGIDMASGEYLAFISENDTLDEHALYEIAKKIADNRELEFIYSDEDSISIDGYTRKSPLFKPDWSPDYFMCVCYTGNLAFYRSDTVKKIGGFSKNYNEYYDYEFILRLLEVIENNHVGHVNEILYHRSEKNNKCLKDSSHEKVIKEEYIKRNHINASLEYVDDIDAYRLVYANLSNPKVSIIIPSKNNLEILKRCIDSIIDITDYSNYEILVIDNGSSPINRAEIEKYLTGLNITYCYGMYDFNYAKMCNIGVEKATGEYLLFLNDDIEIIQRAWMEIMLGHASQKHIGAVGAKLLYPNSNVIQHMGVYNTYNGPDHIFARREDEEVFYFGMNRAECDNIAVTGACLMVSVHNYNMVGGFDENLSVAFNDVDLCLRLFEIGLYNVVRQDVRLYHHESLSRGSDYTDSKKYLRLSKEKQILFYKHPQLKGKDYFINANINALTKNGIYLKSELSGVEVFDEGDSMAFCGAEIGSIDVDDCIIVKGKLLTRTTDELFRNGCFLLVEDPFEGKHKIRILSIDENKEFEVSLDKTIFRIDIVSYRFGVQIIDNKWISRVYWEDKPRDPLRYALYRPSYSSYVEVHDFKRMYSDNVEYYLDEIKSDREGIYLRGWGFVNDYNHYQFKKSIVVVFDNNTALEFEVNEMERVDIAILFYQFNFLSRTGFECRILPELVDLNANYDIILRFKNVFDSSDVNDILLYSSVAK